ncbi:MAG: YlmC/YmxH family sporulation protein [Clostridiales bacterium]|nr:YlmC/YmxH family sporulation protein [Clostridiales bacterium]
MIKASELRKKDVIDVETGKRLGFVYDVEVDLEEGRLTAIILPGPAPFLFFGRPQEIWIPWEDIIKIGEDAILVRAGKGGPA